MTTIARPELEGLERYKFGWADSDAAGAAARRGLSEAVVRDISAKKNEPEWMLGALDRMNSDSETPHDLAV
jgi:Fe-S cluster assembly protein SufB